MCQYWKENLFSFLTEILYSESELFFIVVEQTTKCLWDRSTNCGVLYWYTFDGTRKILNFVWTGRSQEKFWWKSERVLTCKSFFRF